MLSVIRIFFSFMLSVIVLSVIMLNVIMLSVVMLNVVTPLKMPSLETWFSLLFLMKYRHTNINTKRHIIL